MLADGGYLVVSTHHPFMDHAQARGDDYFATYGITEEWTRSGHTVTMHFWHRPLHAMFDAFASTGFDVEELSEPQPLPEAAEHLDAYKKLTTAPRFLFFRLRRT